MRERICVRDVFPARLDIVHCIPTAATGGGLDRSLILMQQRNRIDEGEIFFVIATGARLVGQERQLIRIRIENLERTQEALCIRMLGEQVLLSLLIQQARQGPALTLQAMDRFGLLAAFIDREYQTAI